MRESDRSMLSISAESGLNLRAYTNQTREFYYSCEVAFSAERSQCEDLFVYFKQKILGAEQKQRQIYRNVSLL